MLCKSADPNVSDAELLAIAQWAQRTKREIMRTSMQVALNGGTDHRVSYLAPGTARGTGELQRKHATAMNMNYYRKAGYAL